MMDILVFIFFLFLSVVAIMELRKDGVSVRPDRKEADEVQTDSIRRSYRRTTLREDLERIARGERLIIPHEEHRHIPQSYESIVDYSRVIPRFYDAYRAYLRGPIWHSLRTRVINRDRNRCTKCGSMINLNVHHIHYRGIETMDFHMDQLVTLCEYHHSLEHQH